ncbi:hypothetical protein BH09BAC6_BH09BAC6_07720 [soil metagenome]|jgi:RHS repeat-associated protein
MRKRNHIILKAAAALLMAVLTCCNAFAQTNGPITLSTNSTGSDISNRSITLNPGFSTTVPFSAKIQSIDCIPLTTAPTLTRNYIISNTPRIPGIMNESQLASRSTCELMQSIKYVDGLGRPIQSVQVMGSPFGNDMVMPQAYDQYGREVNKYLPYVPTTATAGVFRPNAVSTDQQAFYNIPPVGVVQIPAAGQVSYSATRFEASPLNRPLEQGAPGLSWQIGGGHTVTTSYNVNTGADAVKQWVVNPTGGASYGASYAAGTLYKTVMMDENQNNNAVIQFKDIDGRIVSRWVQNGAGVYYVTDYIYDDLGNLCYVVPPLPSASPGNPAVTVPISFVETDDVFKNFFYGYHYDGLKRLTEKKIPGQDWQYIVYNIMDQPILTQDANQRAMGIWMVTKYDAQGRVVMTGEYTSASSRSALQATADGITTNLWETFTNATTNYGYTHVSSPDITVSSKVITVAYFDTYDVISNAAVNPGSSIFTAPNAAIDSLDKLPRSLPVATLVNVLGTVNYLFTVTHYDKYGRLVKVTDQNYVGGSAAYNKYDTEESQYSFNNSPTKTVRNHYLPASSSAQLTINSWNAYDHMNRPLLVKQQYITQTNTGSIIALSKTDYNELSQPLTKHLHSTNTASNPDNSTFLQHTDYRYNSRGWLTKINDPANLFNQNVSSVYNIFSEQLDYDQLNNGYAGTAQYNGNISTVSWQTQNPSSVSSPQEKKGYIYAYDPLNRLTNSISKAATSGDNLYNETTSYDELGNILTMVRYNNSVTTPLNSLTYNYTAASIRSNILRSVTDNGTVTESQASAYAYNNNGSITGDTKKTISGMTYNELNLPSTVQLTSKTLYYIYDATGRKLERIAKTGPTVLDDRSYDNGFEYNSNTLEFVHTPAGRSLAPTGSAVAYSFEYQLTDHLGNVRASFNDANNDGILANNEITQTADYYPFGREFNLFNSSIAQRYKYNGKELQDDINEYDYGARFYDAVIGRWNVIDPLAEQARRWTPYRYGFDNPIRNIDPDGMLEYGHDETEMQKLMNSQGIHYIGGAQSGGSHPPDWVMDNKTGKVHDDPNVHNKNQVGKGQTYIGPSGKYIATNGREVLLTPGNKWDYTYKELTQPSNRVSFDQTWGGFQAGVAGMSGLLDMSVDIMEAASAIMLPGGEGAVSLFGRGSEAVEEAAVGVQANRIAGNAFRDEIAGLLQKTGRDIETEVPKRTLFGTRVIDIEVSQGGRVMGGIETKLGNSRYLPAQRAKDMWLKIMEDYHVDVVRGP